MLKLYIAGTEKLMDDRQFQRALSGVRQERKDEILRYRFRKDQVQSLAAELLLWKALADREPDLKKPEIVRDVYGKPRLASAPHFHFNLSHSHQRAVCAVSDREVGVDIEYRSPVSVADLSRYFTEHERAYLNRWQGKEQEREFYRLWTLKESFMKAVGKGLALPLQDFEIHMGPPVTVQHSENRHRYCFFEPDIGQEYCLAVCSAKREPPEMEPEIEMVDLE